MEYLARTNPDLAIVVYWILFAAVILGIWKIAEIWTIYKERH